jgi:hypothetical protein
MSNIRDYIDSCIKNNTTSETSGNLFQRIRNRVKLFTEIKSKGILDSSVYKGIDALIAERVNALLVNSTASTEADTKVKVASTSIEKKRDGVFPLEGVSEPTGYIVWAGNEAYTCPWFTEYMRNDTPGESSTTEYKDTSGKYNLSSRYKFRPFVTDVKFNTSAILTDQNRQIALTTDRVLKLSKVGRRAVISNKLDKASFESEGVDPVFAPIKTIDLALKLPEGDLWCFGKLLKYGDYVVVSVYTFPDARSKTFFEQPRYKVDNKAIDALGYTVTGKILIISTTSDHVSLIEIPKLETQTKTNAILGYSDFILHGGKIFAVRSKSTIAQSTFVAFRLARKKDKTTYEKVKPDIKHTFNSYSFEVVELKYTDTTNDFTPYHVADIKPPDIPKEGKFGITGSQVVYTTAKLAASELNPYTFYIQLFYEQILQIPFDSEAGYDKLFLWESRLGKRLRTDPVFKAWLMAQRGGAWDTEQGEPLYGNTILYEIGSVVPGTITKIVGQIYLEIPTTYDSNSDAYNVHTVNSNSNILYELVGEDTPCWLPYTNDLVPMRGPNADALSNWVIWHLATAGINPKSDSMKVVNFLGIGFREGNHPFTNEMQAKKKADPNLKLGKYIDYVVGTGVVDKKSKWSSALEKKIGFFPFPYSKQYCFTGGNESASNWAIGGYDSWAETFLVTYATDLQPKNGALTDKTARPILIISGIGPYAEVWGATGWDGQYSQSPLIVECFNYQTNNSIKLTEFKHVNDPDFSIVYMQAQESVLGTIGGYYTGFDMTDPTVVLEHGMFPLSQSGSYINKKGQKVNSKRLLYTDIRFGVDPKLVYYSLFAYYTEYNTSTTSFEVNNHYLENRAYRIIDGKDLGVGWKIGNQFMFDIEAAKTITYWWAKTVPAKPTDPVPWWGPCQIDLHVKL